MTSLGEQIKNRREELSITQQQLADKLYITRQTISRWENNQTVPNLDTLVILSDLLNLSLDRLLREDEQVVVNKMSTDIRLKQRYQRWLIISGLLILLISGLLGLLSWGRSRQDGTIDRFNPFLPYKYGYAVLPKRTPTKIQQEVSTDTQGKHHRLATKVPQPVTAYVRDNPFGGGEWLTFQVGMIPEARQNYVYVQHKGSFVKNATLIHRQAIPKNMRPVVGTEYFTYNYKTFGPKTTANPFK